MCCGREGLYEKSDESIQRETLGPDDHAVSCPDCATSADQQALDVTFTAVRPGQSVEEKGRESRLRRVAQRQGLTLMKVPRHDPRADDHLYWLATVENDSGHGGSRRVVSSDVGMTLDEVAEYLTYGMTRAEVMDYLIQSYGPLFGEELIKHLPQPHSAASDHYP